MELKTYKVVLSSRALKQIDTIHDYIALQLQSPLAARKRVQKMILATRRLQVFPHAGFNVDEKLGIRLHTDFQTYGFVEGKYLLFYTIHEEQSLVLISHILDYRSDYLELLMQDGSE
ncbi:type II toxin-antitoxin system RelE/ParE family toxin [Streptococcus downei]|uniref:Plasmid stabilization system protein n=1 Tax=Streptococcus downei MFe28 TaxID=764290 RepID=A0A380JFP7_STRDO|nr:type II toxin-antitoxin system RelE/ParE family toxin [Streptococcus downei]EFQ57965.1 plasmid stabilization system protein, RelE/ParE family [Streptococcus downei F0415]SUN37225.1 plasmid stabilization system protein [Streptococcus downei MFe28]